MSYEANAPCRPLARLFGYAVFYGALSTSPSQAATATFTENFSSTTNKDSTSTTGVWHTGGGFSELGRSITAGWTSNATLETTDGLSMPYAEHIAVSPTLSWSADCAATPDACTIFAGG